jgi:hypothetical protein
MHRILLVSVLPFNGFDVSSVSSFLALCRRPVGRRRYSRRLHSMQIAFRSSLEFSRFHLDISDYLKLSKSVQGQWAKDLSELNIFGSWSRLEHIWARGYVRNQLFGPSVVPNHQ